MEDPGYSSFQDPRLLPTTEELERMFGGPEKRPNPDDCRHCIDVVDQANSRPGYLRVLQVCVLGHDQDGETMGEVVGHSDCDACDYFEEV